MEDVRGAAFLCPFQDLVPFTDVIVVLSRNAVKVVVDMQEGG